MQFVLDVGRRGEIYHLSENGRVHRGRKPSNEELILLLIVEIFLIDDIMKTIDFGKIFDQTCWPSKNMNSCSSLIVCQIMSAVSLREIGEDMWKRRGNNGRIFRIMGRRKNGGNHGSSGYCARKTSKKRKGVSIIKTVSEKKTTVTRE